ncbi:pentatricopeptide repeat-containing protein At2g13600-like [Selaginella moellendorffii]|uniref:pentatricopeptide repeat-containing protein At2g13600-like n=1 Tax=Selaginella moellendorffii TaxID=88036 RepID=UPI000D1CC0AE|nr:pentatricopeptide repeat-containing protein At2g13600-like [Selaginella moellendorffii]|eukprot:XP_024533217.1 pentatricopeptide repeat-containing protein At2g13600-like [Selaginella moellendorffii]
MRCHGETWSALILGYVENGESEVALEFFGRMDCSPNSQTFVAAAKACANLAVKEEATQGDGKMVKTKSLEKGLAVHDGAVKSHCCGDIFEGSSLVDMYSKCGSMVDAWMVFESMPRRDVVLWTSLIQGFVDNGESELALVFFEDMKLSGCCPNSRTYVATLAACASSAMREEAVDVDGKLVKRKSLETGLAIHGEASNNRCCEDVFVGNTLIDMYAKCGTLEEARKVFVERNDPGICWKWRQQAGLGAGLRHGSGERSGRENVYCCGHGLRPPFSIRTTCSARRWKAIANPEPRKGDGDSFSRREVWMLRAQICREQLGGHGYVDNGESELGLELLESMDCAPNSRTLVAGLMACGNVGSSEAGRKIQTEFCRRGLEDDHVVGTCMGACSKPFARCEKMACEQTRSRLSRSSLHAATAAWLNEAGSFSRQWTRTLALFAGFITTAVHGGSVVWRTVLGACRKWKNVEVGIHHYSSLVDLFGRANRLEEAVKVLESRPLRATLWSGGASSGPAEERGSGQDCVRGTDEDRRERLGCVRSDGEHLPERGAVGGS